MFATRAFIRIGTDAYPGGIGAFLVVNGVLSSWFAGGMHQEGPVRSEAEKGGYRWRTLWEALAILVARRVSASQQLHGDH